MRPACGTTARHKLKSALSLAIRISWRLARVTFLVWALIRSEAHAQTAPTPPPQSKSQIQRSDEREAGCRIIYLGIVGALETSQNKRNGVVLIRDTLRGPDYPDVCAKSFSPYVWSSGLHWVLQHFPSHAGPLTKEELERAPKVILVGHSMGGWAVVSVARNLSEKRIPVELSIQIDSVGVTDRTVPRNVKAAAIFHARDILLPITTKKIKAEDSNQTTLVANVLVTGAGHESVTRDPRIRELVMNKVESLRAAMAPPAAGSAGLQASPADPPSGSRLAEPQRTAPAPND